MRLFFFLCALAQLGACSDYAVNPKDQIALADTGAAPDYEPELEVNPASVSLVACTTEETTVSLRNVGQAQLSVYDLIIEGEGWSFSESLAFPIDVAPGDSYTLGLVGSSATATLRVLSNDTASPNTSIALEGAADEPPTVEIVGPAHDSIIDIAAELDLEGKAEDDMDAAGDLQLSWVSSVDGLLASGSPDANGSYVWNWSSTGRTEGPHQLELIAEDSCGNRSATDISVCQQAGYNVDQLDIASWHFEGASSWDTSNSWLELTPAAPNTVGSAFQTSATVSGDAVTIEFLFLIGGGTGADGLSLTALDVNRMTGFLGGSGCGMGYGGGASCSPGPALPGWSIEVDTYYNGGQDPTPEDHVMFTFDGDVDQPAAWAVLPEMEDTGWHTMKVEVAASHVKVQIDGVTYIDANLSGNFSFPAYVGFTAGTGSLTNRHLIDSLQVTENICE